MMSWATGAVYIEIYPRFPCLNGFKEKAIFNIKVKAEKKGFFTSSIVIHQFKNLFGGYYHSIPVFRGNKFTNKPDVLTIFVLLPLKMRILLIDNYDSFTWNLHHLIVDAGVSVIDIIENDKVTPDMVEKADALVFSPGPGLPDDAGLMKSIIREFAGRKKMLGICLGHQAIAEVFGASLLHTDEIFHGTATQLVILEQDYIFRDMPPILEVGRYHSWVVNQGSVPEELLVTAVDQAGVIMAIRHKTLDITGMQFHPESIMTPLGEKMIRNWITG